MEENTNDKPLITISMTAAEILAFRKMFLSLDGYWKAHGTLLDKFVHALRDAGYTMRLDKVIPIDENTPDYTAPGADIKDGYFFLNWDEAWAEEEYL